MSKGSRDATDDQIEKEVLAELQDPDAWDEPIAVPAPESPRPHWASEAKHLELAAKFYVLSVLHRIGAEANLAFGEPENIDITVLQKSGRALTIDVKTLAGTSEWYVEHFKPRKHHFLVFVCFSHKARDPSAVPDVYIAPSNELWSFIVTRKLESVSLESLAKALDAREAWDQLSAESAA